MVKDLSKTVFVLGAGSSASYGYPTGEQLKKLILTNGHDGFSEMIIGAGFGAEEDINRKFEDFKKSFCKLHPTFNDQLIKFQDEFQRSGSHTIDTFLGKYGDDEDQQVMVSIGTLLIAFYITYFETRPDLLSRSSDDWVGYLLFRVLSYPSSTTDSPLDSLPTFISFNYDSLIKNKLRDNLEKEHLICRAGGHLDRNLRFHQVYGGVTPYLHDSNFDEKMFESLPRESSRINIMRPNPIGEIDNDDSLYSILEEAEMIIALGYGFDRLNNRRLFKDIEGLKAVANKLYFTSYGLPETYSSQLEALGAKHKNVKCRTFLESVALQMPLF